MNPSKYLLIVGRLSVVYAMLMFLLLMQALLYIQSLGMLVSFGLYSLLLFSGLGTLMRKQWVFWVTILYGVLMICASIYTILVLPFVAQLLFGELPPCGDTILSACRLGAFMETVYAVFLLYFYQRPSVRAQFVAA